MYPHLHTVVVFVCSVRATFVASNCPVKDLARSSSPLHVLRTCCVGCFSQLPITQGSHWCYFPVSKKLPFTSNSVGGMPIKSVFPLLEYFVLTSIPGYFYQTPDSEFTLFSLSTLKIPPLSAGIMVSVAKSVAI